MDLIRYLINFGDTYYQSSPESFWVKALLALFGGLSSFGIAFFVFYMQNKKKDNDEKKRIKEIRDYIYYCLDALKILIKQQVVILDKRIEELTRDTTAPTLYALHRPMQISAGLNLKQIEKLDVNDTFKILVVNVSEEQKNIKNYQFLLGSGEQLEKISMGLNEINKWGADIYEKYLDLILKQREEINEIIKKFIDEYGLTPDINAFRFSYIDTILKLWRNYFDNNKKYLECLNDLLVSKLMIYCMDTNEGDGGPYDEPESKKLLTCCQKINEYYDYILQNKSTQLDNLKIWVKDLREIMSVYEDITNRIYPEKKQGPEAAMRAQAA